MSIPTPADEALARKLLPDPSDDEDVKWGAAKIAAHVAAQAPSGLVAALKSVRVTIAAWNTTDLHPEFKRNIEADIAEIDAALAAHKARQPDHTEDVRGMVEVLDEVAKHLRMDDDVISALRVIDAALASARHAMGGEGVDNPA